MTSWSLPQILDDLHSGIERDLDVARRTLAHPTSKGDATETVWIELLNKHLPNRYKAQKGFVVDSRGAFSDQIDIVIFDQQYSPLIFDFRGQTVVAAESVYAVFEAKQSINAAEVRYAQDKAESVRRLHRTSLAIPHAGGVFKPKAPPHILAGLLTLESDWTPALGESLHKALRAGRGDARLDLGCVAAHGYFMLERDSGEYPFRTGGKHATGFLFHLFSALQVAGTVPMIDMQAYAAWLNP